MHGSYFFVLAACCLRINSVLASPLDPALTSRMHDMEIEVGVAQAAAIGFADVSDRELMEVCGGNLSRSIKPIKLHFSLMNGLIIDINDDKSQNQIKTKLYLLRFTIDGAESFIDLALKQGQSLALTCDSRSFDIRFAESSQLLRRATQLLELLRTSLGPP